MSRSRAWVWVVFVSTCGVAAFAEEGADGGKGGAVLEVPRDHKTIQAAVDAANDGDTVLVAPGVYRGRVMIRGKAVTLASHYVKAADEKLIGRTILEANGTVIHVTESAKPGVRIVGFTIRKGGNGILCAARGVTIEHNRVVACGDGIHFVSGEGVIRHNVLEMNRDDAIDVDGSSAAVIEHNTIRNNRDDGIEIRLHVYRGTEPLNIVIRHNLITGSREDGIQIIDHAGPSNRIIRIERNIIRDTAMAAIGMMNGGNTREDYRGAAIPDPIYVLNNTFIGNGHGLCGGANVLAVNNIFTRTRRTALKGVAGQSVVAATLLFRNRVDAKASNLRKPTITKVDPKLEKDGRLTAASPCIDAGIPSIEWGGKTVPVVAKDAFTGKAPDLGAHEFSPVADPK